MSGAPHFCSWIALRAIQATLAVKKVESGVASYMSTARVLIKQSGVTYRFIRFETSSDGSLLALLDRDARSKRGSFDLTEKGLVATHENGPDKVLPSVRFSIHTTGVIHRYAARERKGSIQIEPLYALTKLTDFGFISIPRVSRLDLFDPRKHRSDSALSLEIPDGVSERITFLLEIGPKPQEPSTFGMAFHYELYSVVVRVVPDPQFDSELSNHFVHGIFGRPCASADPVTAELEFYQRLHGRGGFVFREDKSGAYIAMAVVPMAKPPTLKIVFSRPDLSIEVSPFDGKAPTHKVRSWICDKGGRNKTEDLRRYITWVELNAEL